MNGPELSVDSVSGRVLVAYMTSTANDVHWALHDPANPAAFFSSTAGTPTAEVNERYATAVASTSGDVLMVRAGDGTGWSHCAAAAAARPMALLHSSRVNSWLRRCGTSGRWQ